jgi:hypothetical protein
MTTGPDQNVEARQRLAVAAGAALLAAGLILVMFVLPAEYGVDPLGTGARVGLLDLGVVGQQVEALSQSTANGTGQATIVVAQDRPFKQETVEFKVAARQGMEYKYRLDKGEALLYSWKTTGPVNYEFHAEPDGAPLRADLRESRSQERSVGNADGAIPGHPWVVLGEHHRSGNHHHAHDSGLLQPVSRIPQRTAHQEQDVLETRQRCVMSLILLRASDTNRLSFPLSWGSRL